ncbi:hypothetical protein [Anabaena catenula]|uniref:Uncharacterized protein n=1 Tax=Anabaena catenula FACHB-362 TaxID=2692877 RepID=A0ABR8J5V2_9NOST|nr:hypothetical protein [Anabaena catenula]MBD2693756.1 hypothetical protein [Anabaena catenula FACHB-362]
MALLERSRNPQLSPKFMVGYGLQSYSLRGVAIPTLRFLGNLFFGVPLIKATNEFPSASVHLYQSSSETVLVIKAIISNNF